MIDSPSSQDNSPVQKDSSPTFLERNHGANRNRLSQTESRLIVERSIPSEARDMPVTIQSGKTGTNLEDSAKWNSLSRKGSRCPLIHRITLDPRLRDGAQLLGEKRLERDINLATDTILVSSFPNAIYAPDIVAEDISTVINGSVKSLAVMHKLCSEPNEWTPQGISKAFPALEEFSVVYGEDSEDEPVYRLVEIPESIGDGAHDPLPESRVAWKQLCLGRKVLRLQGPNVAFTVRLVAPRSLAEEDEEEKGGRVVEGQGEW